MNPMAASGHRSVTRLAVTTAVLVLIVTGAITASTLRSDHPVASPERPPTVSPTAEQFRSETVTDDDTPSSSIAQAEAFAREVTLLLFTWDTVTGPEPVAIRGKVVALADLTGEETPGLLVDLDAYLPDDVTWRHLDGLGARQWIEVETATVPSAWEDAVAHEPGLAGTYAVNVTGTRHREATAVAVADRTENPVRFTAFVRCTADGACFLLRLGRLGETWER